VISSVRELPSRKKKEIHDRATRPFDINYFSEQFSGFNGDIGVAFSPGNQGFPTYLGTPAGRIETFNPALFGAFPNGCVLVGPPVVPGLGISRVPVPTCP
jgi:hypothetical protein